MALHVQYNVSYLFAEGVTIIGRVCSCEIYTKYYSKYLNKSYKHNHTCDWHNGTTAAAWNCESAYLFLENKNPPNFCLKKLSTLQSNDQVKSGKSIKSKQPTTVFIMQALFRQLADCLQIMISEGWGWLEGSWSIGHGLEPRAFDRCNVVQHAPRMPTTKRTTFTGWSLQICVMGVCNPTW